MIKVTVYRYNYTVPFDGENTKWPLLLQWMLKRKIKCATRSTLVIHDSLLHQTGMLPVQQIQKTAIGEVVILIKPGSRELTELLLFKGTIGVLTQCTYRLHFRDLIKWWFLSDEKKAVTILSPRTTLVKMQPC